MSRPPSATGRTAAPRGGPTAVILTLLPVALAALVLAAACSGSDAAKESASPASSVPPTPGPGEAGGPLRPTPPPELVAELPPLPTYPCAGQRSVFSTTGQDLHVLYFIAKDQAPAPEEVIKFYTDKLAALGWLGETGPTTQVVTWPKEVNREPSTYLVRTWVRKDIRVRLAVGPGRDKVLGDGLSITLEIEPAGFPALPTPRVFATGVPSTPLPMPAPVEPIPPIGTGPHITPTLTPTPAGAEPSPPPSDGPTPTLTPTPTPPPWGAPAAPPAGRPCSATPPA